MCYLPQKCFLEMRFGLADAMQCSCLFVFGTTMIMKYLMQLEHCLCCI